MMFPVMELETVYFYTATILNWQNLLKPDKYKVLIISSLEYLVKRKKMAVYGFVIMPNHVHFIWEMLAKNGKELPHASFMKYTGHQFLNDLQAHHPQVLPYFLSDANNRQYQFWQRNSLPIPLYSKKICEQKLDYIHANPVQQKWNLVSDFTEYFYSSASFYECGKTDFSFLTDYRERF